MNVTDTESPTILAKTCGCKVTYFIIDSCHSLCLDKKDRLTRYSRDEMDKKIIEKEIAELKMSLDLIN